MKIKRFIPFALILISVIAVNACCSCKNAVADGGKVKGYITVVGNEPFSKLAIKTDDDKVYILKCKPETERELWKKQGDYYLVTFTKTEKDTRAPVLIVEEITPLNKNSK